MRRGALFERGRAQIHTPLLVPRLPVYRRGRRHGDVFFPTEAVKVEGALAEHASPAASGNLMHRRYCPSCGTPVFTQTEARLHFLGVRAGTLDDPEIAKPQMAIWTSSAPSWAAFEPGIPHEPKQAPTPKPKA